MKEEIVMLLFLKSMENNGHELKKELAIKESRESDS